MAETNTTDNKKTARAGRAPKKKNQLDKERELARLHYMNGESQKAVAERLGVSAQSLTRWVREGGWDTLRAAKTVTRRELVMKMLQQLDQKLESGDWTADELIKATSAIEKLDKQTNIVTMIEVFTAFNNWLVARMQIDPELTPETLQVINKYQDLFVNESMSHTKVNFM